ncbi:2'-5' RNA ligase family protein [soil metagenome]
MNKPMVVTLQLEEKARQYFNEQRKAYFPAHLNYLEAHLTLFHALPPDEKIITQTLQALSSRGTIRLNITGLRNIGNGVAYTVASDELQIMHASMQRDFESFLIGKDRQKLWPHITVQNKVTAFKASKLLEQLIVKFVPFSIMAIGISTFFYDGGPWIPVDDYKFKL